MRIALVASWYYSAKTPLRGSFVREQAQALRKLGHEVLVAYLDTDGDHAPMSLRRRDYHGVVEIGLTMPFGMHRVIGFYWPHIISKRLRRPIEEFGPDVIHAHAVRPGAVIASFISRKLRLPLAITEHKGNVKDYWMSPHGYRQIRRAYAAADLLIAVSDSLSRELTDLFPSLSQAWVVQHNGVDTEAFNPDNRAVTPFAHETVRLLFLGGAAKKKGLPLLLEAMQDLPDNFSLSVAGPNSDSLRDAPGISALGGRVQVLGPIPRSEVPDQMRSHDLIVVPSLYETFSLVSAEALACGTPVAVSRCGGPEEFVARPFGELFDVGDAEGLTAAISQLEDQGDQWDPAASYERIKSRFSIDKLARELTSHYEKLVHATSNR